MVLLIDNYDSFTFNLAHRLGELGAEVKVVRNDRLTLDDIANLRPQRLVISPGPGRPESAGVTVEALRRFAGRLPILGVCLGHQSIGQAYGGQVVRAQQLMHGKTSQIHHNGKGVFKGLKTPFTATRYHSLSVLKDDLPADLEVTAWTDDGEIMGFQHRSRPVYGVQFHPESIATECGHELLANFLSLAGVKRLAEA